MTSFLGKFIKQNIPKIPDDILGGVAGTFINSVGANINDIKNSPNLRSGINKAAGYGVNGMVRAGAALNGTNPFQSIGKINADIATPEYTKRAVQNAALGSLMTTPGKAVPEPNKKVIKADVATPAPVSAKPVTPEPLISPDDFANKYGNGATNANYPLEKGADFSKPINNPAMQEAMDNYVRSGEEINPEIFHKYGGAYRTYDAPIRQFIPQEEQAQFDAYLNGEMSPQQTYDYRNQLLQRMGIDDSW